MELLLNNTGALQGACAYEKFREYIPEHLKKIIDNRSENRRLPSAIAYGMLFYKLREMGISKDISFSENGKPYIEGNPVYFSLSHTKCLAVCAISNYRVGVDAEHLRPVRLSAVKKFSPLEQSFILSAKDMQTAFLKVWTRKEAGVKEEGGRIFQSLKELCTVSQEENFKTFSFEDYIISVCSRENDFPDAFRVHTLENGEIAEKTISPCSPLLF